METKREVVMYPSGREQMGLAEKITNDHLGSILADLLGYTFAGHYRGPDCHTGVLYFVPYKTIIGFEEALQLGIHTPADLFGGIVPHAFMATKAISHGLIHPAAAQPEGWNKTFTQILEREAVVLPGFTIFGLDDARVAIERLLPNGTVRAKRAVGIDLKGQTIICTVEDLETFMAEIPKDELARCGVVLERHLEGIQTLSIGHVIIGDFTLSYVGKQRTTTNNYGEPTYGGSDLMIMRGGFDELLNLPVPDHVRLAVQQTVIYDQAAIEHLGIIASRRNYDVGQGYDAGRNFVSGVLEQSWRIGGASGAEIIGARVLRSQPETAVIQASTHNQFGDSVKPPDGAIVHFQGYDYGSTGYLAVYTTVKRLRTEDICSIFSA
jgi:hypothetical protein